MLNVFAGTSKESTTTITLFHVINIIDLHIIDRQDWLFLPYY